MNLRPDYVILDEQENKLEMAEQLRANSIKILTSNVTDFDSVIQFLQSMADILDESKLNEFAERYKSVIGRDQISTEKFWAQILLKGDVPDAKSAIDYVIWKDPFMVIGQNTFIANNLKLVGFNLDRSEKYPEVAETELRQRFCLFSSEPYRFDRKFEKMILSGFQGALVDGEKLSWYGIRNLCFLESCL